MPRVNAFSTSTDVVRRAIGALALVVAVSLAPAAAAGCGGPLLMMRNASTAELQLLCRAWRTAHRELAPLGIAARRPVLVELDAERRPDPVLATAFGAFDSVHRVVRLRPLAAYLQGAAGGFAQAPSTELWTSYAVHEFVHALIDPHVRRDAGPRVTHEFVAYAVQLRTLAPSIRRAVLARYATRPFGDARQVNAITYSFGPHRFGVRAFLTVEAADDRVAYLRARLAEGFPPILDELSGS